MVVFALGKNLLFKSALGHCVLKLEKFGKLFMNYDIICIMIPVSNLEFIGQKLFLKVKLSFSDNQKAKSGAGSEIGGSGSLKERIGRGKSQ